MDERKNDADEKLWSSLSPYCSQDATLDFPFPKRGEILFLGIYARSYLRFSRSSSPSIFLLSPTEIKSSSLRRRGNNEMIRSAFRAQILRRGLGAGHWYHLWLSCPLPAPLGTAANLFLPPLQKPRWHNWHISIYGTCVAVACLIRSKQALICPPISVFPRHKLEIDFCLELKALRPFHWLSSVCVCVCVCTCLCMKPYMPSWVSA